MEPLPASAASERDASALVSSALDEARKDLSPRWRSSDLREGGERPNPLSVAVPFTQCYDKLHKGGDCISYREIQVIK